jgi:predicted transcriptional regulator
MFELPTKIVEPYGSNHLMSLLSFFHPSYRSIYAKVALKGTRLSLIRQNQCGQDRRNFQKIRATGGRGYVTVVLIYE